MSFSIKTLKAVLFALLAFLAFSIMNTTDKFVLYNKLLPFPIYFTYIKIATILILIIFGLLFYGIKFFQVKNKKYVFIRCVILTINALTTTLAVAYLPLDIFYALVFLMPLVSTLLAIFLLKEKFTKFTLVIVILGFIGAITVLQPQFSSKSILIGTFLTLCAITTGSLSAIVTRKYLMDENAYSATFYALFLALIVGFILSLGTLHGQEFQIPSLKVILLVFISATCTVTGAVFFMKSFQEGSVTYVAPIQYTQLLWGITFGYLLFHDKTTFTTLLGCFIIALATILNIFYNKVRY